jgi:hypothetical protein
LGQIGRRDLQSPACSGHFAIELHPILFPKVLVAVVELAALD